MSAAFCPAPGPRTGRGAPAARMAAGPGTRGPHTRPHPAKRVAHGPHLTNSAHHGSRAPRPHTRPHPAPGVRGLHTARRAVRGPHPAPPGTRRTHAPARPPRPFEVSP